MLILTRRLGESITVGENVKLTVLNIKGNQVRIGIDAPKDVSIHRTELLITTEDESIEQEVSLEKETKKRKK